MLKSPFASNDNIAWCPGCGNFPIRQALVKAFEQLDLDPRKVVVVSGIGQAAKMPQYLDVNYFNGLHGRALPVATAVKAANPELTVIAVGGDGDMYGEGGNHFIHTVRRNPGILHLVHNNMVYGLTKGQASPTSQRGFVTPVQRGGVILQPFNPLAVSLSLGAGFVARGFSGDTDSLASLIVQGIRFPGYALVDIFQPCVTFNKTNTFQWFKDNTVPLDPFDKGLDSREAALAKVLEDDPWPIGVFRNKAETESFEQSLPIYKKDPTPLYKRRVS